MITVKLSTKETFKIPDKYEVNITTIKIHNGFDDDIIRMKCLIVEDKTSEPYKKRYYPLSHIISFGDDIGFLP